MQAIGRFHKTVDISAVDFAEDYDFLYIETAGALVTTDQAGTSVPINVPGNFYHFLSGKSVVKVGTTATGITAYKYIQDF